MKIEDEDQLEYLVRLLGCAAHAAYESNLHGWPCSQLDKFKDPKPGDVVLETSTYYMAFAEPSKHCSPLDAIGILESITDEPMVIEGWNEADDGPIPKERIFTIRTFDGRQYRWSNADFIRVPSTVRFKEFGLGAAPASDKQP